MLTLVAALHLLEEIVEAEQNYLVLQEGFDLERAFAFSFADSSKRELRLFIKALENGSVQLHERDQENLEKFAKLLRKIDLTRKMTVMG